jgi:hypothetical protein
MHEHASADMTLLPDGPLGRMCQNSVLEPLSRDERPSILEI